jgi:hypothetical protein
MENLYAISRAPAEQDMAKRANDIRRPRRRPGHGGGRVANPFR